MTLVKPGDPLPLKPRCSSCDRERADIIVGDGPPVCRGCIRDAVQMAEGDEVLRRLFGMPPQ